VPTFDLDQSKCGMWGKWVKSTPADIKVKKNLSLTLIRSVYLCDTKYRSSIHSELGQVQD